ncbi:4-(cytidine 5'-diphospho)-2-C-methyl-D-erythritol kinase [Syntrophomonas erecta]
MSNSLMIKAPAKINIFLDVKGKRPDGYHELETVMHQIDLVDQVYLEKSTGIEVKTNNPMLPEGEENLAYQAAWLMMNHFNIPGVKIYIDKTIPVGAGLAGGSTDAAAVLRGINQLYNLGINMTTLCQWGAQIGSDVPFCVLGGTALVRGRGEVLTPLPSTMSLHMVLVKPNFELSTRDVYQAFNRDKVEVLPAGERFLDAWYKCDMIGMCKEMVNVLESVSVRQYPEIFYIKQRLRQTGALVALMSGSGPSVFAIFDQQDLARKAVDLMNLSYREVYQVSSYTSGGGY